MASTYRFPGGGKTARVGAQLWGVGGGDELVLRLHTEQSVSNPNTIDSKRISTYHDESTAKKRVKNKLISNNGGSPKWKDKTKKFDAAATGQSLGTPISHVEHFISLRPEFHPRDASESRHGTVKVNNRLNSLPLLVSTTHKHVLSNYARTGTCPAHRAHRRPILHPRQHQQHHYFPCLPSPSHHYILFYNNIITPFRSSKRHPPGPNLHPHRTTSLPDAQKHHPRNPRRCASQQTARGPDL